MKSAALEKIVTDLVKSYVENNIENQANSRLWREPLVGFADAYDPYIQKLPEIVTKTHKLPQDFMESPTTVISYFIPFTPEMAGSNVGVEYNLASSAWARAYDITNTMMNRLNEYLVSELIGLGFRAVVPSGIPMLPDIIKSNWSQRHLAYAAGLGTFGLNNMLISKSGCCGRYSSIIAALPVKTSSRPGLEYCLYKRGGSCGKCVKNCFCKALTEKGFDRNKCLAACMKNMEIHGVDVCGKCDTDIPCAFSAPLSG